ncbi:stressosome-associated protein Prli42 [Niallia sp. 03133]
MEDIMRNRNFRKTVVYLMIFIMLLSTLLVGLGMLFS